MANPCTARKNLLKPHTMLEHLLLTVGDLWMALLDKFVAQAKCRKRPNGHKRVHAIKFQVIATPNGLVANLYGPVEGRRHNSGMLADSAILPLLKQYLINQNGNQL